MPTSPPTPVPAAHAPLELDRGQALRAAPSAEERERVVDALCAHFAADTITSDELERLLDRVYAAESRAALLAIVDDVPALPEEFASRRTPLLVPPSEVPERGVLLAVMAANERKGSWIVPRHLKVIAVMGGASLDLRNARFGPGITEIEAYAFMGGVEVILPPGVRCESFGAAFLGGFESKAGDATALSPSQPVVRLSGLAVFGGVDSRTSSPPGSKARRGGKHRD